MVVPLIEKASECVCQIASMDNWDKQPVDPAWRLASGGFWLVFSIIFNEAALQAA
jgi:hypothetical protein